MEDNPASPLPSMPGFGGAAEAEDVDLLAQGMSSGLRLQHRRVRLGSERTPASALRPAKRLDDQPSSGDSDLDVGAQAALDQAQIANASPQIVADTPHKPSNLKEMKDELTCSICLEICTRPCTTPCGHTFCRACLRQSLKHCRKCPKCRAPIPDGPLRINTVIWNMVRLLFPDAASAGPVTPETQGKGAPPPQQARATAVSRHTEVSGAFRPPWRHLLGPAGGGTEQGSRTHQAAEAARSAQTIDRLPASGPGSQPRSAATDTHRPGLLSALISGSQGASGVAGWEPDAMEVPLPASQSSSRLNAMLSNPFTQRRPVDQGHIQRAPRAVIGPAPSSSSSAPSQPAAFPLMNPFARIRSGQQASQLHVAQQGRGPTVQTASQVEDSSQAQPIPPASALGNPFVRVRPHGNSLGVSHRVQHQVSTGGTELGQLASLSLAPPATQQPASRVPASPAVTLPAPQEPGSGELVGASMLQDSDCELDMSLTSPTLGMSRGSSLSRQPSSARAGMDVSHMSLVPEDYQRRRWGRDTVTDQDDVLQGTAVLGVVSRVPHSCAEDDTARPARDQLSLRVGSLGSGSPAVRHSTHNLRQSASFTDASAAPVGRDQPTTAGALRMSLSDQPGAPPVVQSFRQVAPAALHMPAHHHSPFQPSPTSAGMVPASRFAGLQPASPLGPAHHHAGGGGAGGGAVQGVGGGGGDEYVDLQFDEDDEELEEFTGLDLFSSSPPTIEEVRPAVPLPAVLPAVSAQVPVAAVVLGVDSPAVGTAARPIELSSDDGYDAGDDWGDEQEDVVGSGLAAVVVRYHHPGALRLSQSAGVGGVTTARLVPSSQKSPGKQWPVRQGNEGGSGGGGVAQRQEAARMPLQAVSLNQPVAQPVRGGQLAGKPNDVKRGAAAPGGVRSSAGEVVSQQSDAASRDAPAARGHVSGLRPLRRSQRTWGK